MNMIGHYYLMIVIPHLLCIVEGAVSDQENL